MLPALFSPNLGNLSKCVEATDPKRRVAASPVMKVNRASLVTVMLKTQQLNMGVKFPVLSYFTNILKFVPSIWQTATCWESNTQSPLFHLQLVLCHVTAVSSIITIKTSYVKAVLFAVENRAS